ncbi:hypothetical protein CRM22_004652 [Opisthorchis felineus]|uniref:FUN14 domain-containing protein 1 n=1 Tax=Opisthorchis felineus TaxID=147828 RepID=A0A4S2LW29_OPIFE|nr:hypothetical protein CRM22_004652 [Opisthorchis felineus]
MDSEIPTDRALSAVSETLDAIKKRPHQQQIVMGVGSGLVAGYIFAKIGRVAALILGGGLIALQCAVQQDCIHVDWNRLRRLHRNGLNSGRWFNNSFYNAIGENRVFFGSFAGGFLVAISFS